MTRAACVVLLVALCLLPVAAQADDPSLVEIYNTLFQTNISSDQLELYRVANDQSWGAMIGQVRAEAMFAESNSCTLGVYTDLGIGLYTTDLFSVTTRGYLNGQPRTIMNQSGAFGLYMLPGAFATKFSEAALNPGSTDNLRTYASPFANIYLLAWEEKDALADNDFNDLVAVLRVDTPPVAVAGTVGSSPFPAAPNHRATVTLNGLNSSDADADPLTYHWSWPGGAATGATPEVTLFEGSTIVTLIVNDGMTDSTPSTVTVSVSTSPNVAPVPEAGADQTVAPDLDHNARVTLNGSGSSDANDDTLTYAWTWSGGSASGVAPTVVLPEGQTYTISLRVHDGWVWSGYDTCQVTVGTVDNAPPVVTAPTDISVHAGQDGIAHVPLTAYGYDPNSDPLVYNWSWSGGSASGQTITADLPGNPSQPLEPIAYNVSVQVFDGLAYSAADTCQVTVLPARPVAAAGPDPGQMTADLNHTKQVSLDGSSSYSRYGLPLTYRWSWGTNGSATGPTPTVTVPEGTTTVVLVVNDGSCDSDPDMVVIDVLPVDNLAPVANAGQDQVISPGSITHRATVQLDGSASWDPNQDALGYRWTWTDLGTGAERQATGPTPQVDLYEGVNTITLHVSDSRTESTDTVAVNLVPTPNLPPTANAGTDQTVWPRVDRTGVVRLDGSASSDPNADPLTYTWTWTDLSTGQPKVEHGVKPTIIVPVGVTVVHLVVNDGHVNSINDSHATITVTPLHALVPTDFTTVQAAIDFSQDGDTVIVEKGVHSGGIDFKGKAITVQGETGWEDCIIEATGVTVVNFASGEGPQSRLLNVTIRKGFNISGGAGVRIVGASPTIISCYLTGSSQGGAIYVSGASAAPRLANLLIQGNMCNQHASAIWVTDNASPLITNCTIYGNTSGGSLSGAIYLDGNCAAEFRDCIIWNNISRSLIDNFTRSTFTYCDIPEPISGTGNIASEPGFITGNLSDFYLKQVASGQTANSVCVDAGSCTVAEWLTEMAAYGPDVAAEMAKANTRKDGQPDTGNLDIGFHNHPKPVKILRAWFTNTSNTEVVTLVRQVPYYFWVQYQTEGYPGVRYLARRTGEANGSFTLIRSAKSRNKPGLYTKKIGTPKNPIIIAKDAFTLPPGISQIDVDFTMTVKLKRVGTAEWLGQDQKTITVHAK